MPTRYLLVEKGSPLIGAPNIHVIATYANGETLVRRDGPAAESERGTMPFPHGLVLDGINAGAIERAKLRPSAEAGNNPFPAYIELAGPVHPEWLEKLQRSGLTLIRFQPHTAYLASGTAQAFNRAEALDFVVQIVPLTRELKPAPVLRENGDDPVWIVISEAGDVPEVVDKIQSIDGLVLQGEPDRAAGLARVPAILSSGMLDDILNIPFVLAVEKRRPVVPEDEIAGLILAGSYDVQKKPTGDYLGWLEDRGVSGRGVTIGIVDDGVDEAHPAFTGRIVSRDQGRAWHGTFVAGHAAGRYLDETDENGFIYGLGMAPSADIVTQDNNDAASFSCRETVTTAGPSGAFGTIQNNSWGMGTQDPMDYGSLEAAYDGLVRNATPGEFVARPLTVCFSAGNSGSDGLTRPKAAKNVLVTGNSENYRPEIGGSESDNIDHMFTGAHGSSHGNCGDGRIRPHVVAPGEWTASANFDSQPGQAEYISDKLTWGGGTSGASPKTAGACALLTQWWRGNNANATPSPALLRAMIVNGAEDMGFGGPIPNNRQGWGRVNLANVLSEDVHHTYVDQTSILRHRGESRSWRLRVTDTDMPVRVTLTWTDPPGPLNSGTASVPAVVNKLALRVECGGRTYRGNNFVNGSSVAGPLSDPAREGLDNLQNVFIPSGQASSSFTVTVQALNVTTNCLTNAPADPQQDFALVITNGHIDSGSMPTDLFMLVDDTSPGASSSVGDVVVDDDDDDDLFETRPTLRFGSRGSHVEQLQLMLQRTGHLTGAVDGHFGTKTQSAVVAFQRDEGLAADGIVGAATWAALDRAVGSTEPDPSTDPVDPVDPGGSIDPVTLPSTVRFGDRGPNVQLLQQKLQERGFLSGSIDGIFGNGTLRAVKAFQAFAGVAVDGVVGQSTWRALLTEASRRALTGNSPASSKAGETRRKGTAAAEVARLARIAERSMRAAPMDAHLELPLASEANDTGPLLSQALKRLMDRFDEWVASERRKAALIVVGAQSEVNGEALRALRRLAVQGDLYLVSTSIPLLQRLLQALHRTCGIHCRYAEPSQLEATLRSVSAEAAGLQELVLVSADDGPVGTSVHSLDIVEADQKVTIEVEGVYEPLLSIVPPGGSAFTLSPTSRRKGFRLSVENNVLTLELVPVEGRPWSGTWQLHIRDAQVQDRLRLRGYAGPGPLLRLKNCTLPDVGSDEKTSCLVSVKGENGVGVTKVRIQTMASSDPGAEHARPIEVVAKPRRLDRVGAERPRNASGESSAVSSLDARLRQPGSGLNPGFKVLAIEIEGVTENGAKFARRLYHAMLHFVGRGLWRRLRKRARSETSLARDIALDRIVNMPATRLGNFMPIKPATVYIPRKPLLRPGFVDAVNVSKLPTIKYPVLPQQEPNVPIRSGRLLLWPDKGSWIYYMMLAEPARLEFDMVIERDAEMKILGGTATMAIGVFPETLKIAMADAAAVATDDVAIMRGAGAILKHWRYEPLRLNRLDAALDIPEAHRAAEPRITVNPRLGTALFLVELTELGAQVWRQALDDGFSPPGVCTLTAWYVGADRASQLEARSQALSVSLGTLLKGVMPEAVRILNPDIAIDATLVLDGDPTIQAMTVEMRALNGTVRTQAFGPEGGTVVLRLVSENPRRDRVDWAAQVAFTTASWPALRIAGTLSDATGWSDLIAPSSWMRAVSITTILLGADGNVLSGDVSDPSNRVSGAVDFSAPFLDGATSLHTGFETSSQENTTIMVPRPPDQPLGALKLTVFAIRNGMDNMKVLTLAPDEEWVMIKVYANSRIEIATNRTPGSETDRDPAITRIGKAMAALAG